MVLNHSTLSEKKKKKRSPDIGWLLFKILQTCQECPAQLFLSASLTKDICNADKMALSFRNIPAGGCQLYKTELWRGRERSLFSWTKVQRTPLGSSPNPFVSW